MANYVFFVISATICIQSVISDSGKSCEAPPVFATSRPCERKEEYPVATTIKYCCDAGFRYSGGYKIAVCVLDDDGEKARWDFSANECHPVSCSPPDPIPNGHIIGNRYTFPNSVKYECDKGYELQGVSQSYCEVTGEWSGRVPRCQVVTCLNPDKIENGSVSFQSTKYSSVALYKCSPGYLIKGENKRRCNHEGVWEPGVPTCVEVICPEPKDPLHGKVTLISGGVRKGSLISYDCNKGKTLTGEGFARCMDDGKWSSEPPTCTETCSVKRLYRGKLGVIEKIRGRERFVKKDPGTKINSGEKLLLRCNSDYELPVENLPPGDIEILCEDGHLKPDPACHPAWCRQPPPDNGIGTPPLPPYSKESKSVVEYENACLGIGKTLQEKKATCHFGTWEVTEAKCQDARCKLTDLETFNVDTSDKGIYENGEMIKFRCQTGYEPSPSVPDILCVESHWQVTAIPCKPKNCEHPPPAVDGTTPNVFKGRHGERVAYRSIQPYELVEEGSVVCSFGQWRGKLPVFKDNRCHTSRLVEYDGIVKENKTIRNNHIYRPSCLDGYNNLQVTFKCNVGEWEKEDPEQSIVCEPGSCTIPYVVHGEFYVLEIIDVWYKPTKRNLKKVHPNTLASHNSNFQFKCQDGRKFQGIIETSEEGLTITCDKKQWVPKPECWFFPPSTTTVSTTTTADEPTENPFNTNETKDPILEDRFNNETDEDLNNSEERVTGPENIVNTLRSCAYTNNDSYRLIFLGDEITGITEKDVVSHGSELKFGCQPIGLVRLIGPPSAICVDGEWQPKYFPNCSRPTAETQVSIMIDSPKGYITRPGNVAIVEKNHPLHVVCYEGGRRRWPTLYHDHSIGRTIAKNTRNEQGGHYAYIVIPNMVEEASGTFTCYSDSDSYSVSVYVAESYGLMNIPCSRLKLTHGLLAQYEPQSDTIRPDTRVHFSCTDGTWDLKGVASMTCLKTGKWSADQPICIKKCWPAPEIGNGYKKGESTVGSSVTYTCHRGYKLIGSSTTTCQDTGFWSHVPPTCLKILCPVPSIIPNGNVHFASLHFDSETRYQCKEGYKLIGNDKSRCAEDGKWSNEPPVCKDESRQCYSYHLLDTLPEGVFGLNITSDYMPSGSVVQLVCHGEAMVLLGKKYAICTEKGFWEVWDTKCVPGCHPIQKLNNSSLVIEEVKEMYRFGDYITFSCPKNEKLSMDVEHIVCLSNGWSDDRVPSCQPSEE